jgi:peptidoglycan/xylan/chitin deacetylase (PgdA/CDA1 family)
MKKMGDLFRRSVLITGRCSGVFRLFRFLNQKGLLALTYHGVIDVDDNTVKKFAFLYRNCVNVNQFEQQMVHLKKYYTIFGPSDLEKLFEEKGNIPPRCAIVTFDDGLLNNATVAWPILKRHKISAFFFLPTGFIDAASDGKICIQWTEEIAVLILKHQEIQNGYWNMIVDVVPELKGKIYGNDLNKLLANLIPTLKTLPDSELNSRLLQLKERLHNTIDPKLFPADRDGGSIFSTMTWDQAKRMEESGMGIGSHTVSHKNLLCSTDEEARQEIVNSRHRIQEEISRPCLFFAYPYGKATDFNGTHVSILSKSGYLSAFTSIRGINRSIADPYALFRIDVSRARDLIDFEYHLSEGFRL